MQGRLVARCLGAKLSHPAALVLVTSDGVCRAFEDAQLMGHELGLEVDGLAQDSAREAILACGVPNARLESSVELLGQAGWNVHVV
jgi:hypothetical protein